MQQKICVYAICKNEEAFVQRWYNSMSEADYIVVLDTGSTDNTVSLLTQCGVTVQQKIISPWRFDVARNESLKLIPSDTTICVCTDLDEVFRPGWAQQFKDQWEEGLDRIRYTFIWNWVNDKPGVQFLYEKSHTYGTHHWEHAVHEILLPNEPHEERKKDVPSIVLEHHADPLKSRSNYLPLLELDVSERPNDDRARHYYARELMFHGEYQKAIEQFKIHLSLPSATWEAERATSMRYIAKCSTSWDEKEKWLYRAIAEAPYLREPLMDMAFLQYKQENWHGVIYFVQKALNIKINQGWYVNDPSAWNELPYDLLSIAYFNLHDFHQAKQYCEKALEINPNDKRIITNYHLIRGKEQNDKI